MLKSIVLSYVIAIIVLLWVSSVRSPESAAWRMRTCFGGIIFSMWGPTLIWIANPQMEPGVMDALVVLTFFCGLFMSICAAFVPRGFFKDEPKGE